MQGKILQCEERGDVKVVPRRRVVSLVILDPKLFKFSGDDVNAMRKAAGRAKIDVRFERRQKPRPGEPISVCYFKPLRQKKISRSQHRKPDNTPLKKRVSLLQSAINAVKIFLKLRPTAERPVRMRSVKINQPTVQPASASMEAALLSAGLALQR